jgi:hypothetical protein
VFNGFSLRDDASMSDRNDIGPIPMPHTSAAQAERLARLAARRRPAVAAKVVATGLAASGFAGPVGYLASREARPTQAAPMPTTIAPATTAAGQAAPSVIVTDTRHRTVYVDEFGNPVAPPSLPDLSATSAASAVHAVGIVPHGTPFGPSPTLAPASDSMLPVDPAASTLPVDPAVSVPAAPPTTAKPTGTHATNPPQQPVATAAPQDPAATAPGVIAAPVETAPPQTAPPATSPPATAPPTTAAPVVTAPPPTAPPPPPPTTAAPATTAPPPPACQGTQCPP